MINFYDKVYNFYMHLITIPEYAYLKSYKILTGNPSVTSNNETEEYKLLYKAAKFGNLYVVNLILQNMNSNATSAHVNPMDKQGNTALHRAAEIGHLEIMRALYTKIASISLNATYSTINPENKYGQTPLHFAASKGHFLVVKAILGKFDTLASCDQINPKDRNGVTPLHKAAEFGHTSVIEIILEKMNNANIENINPRDNSGKTPLHLMSGRGYKDCMLQLFNKMGSQIEIKYLNPKDQLGNTPLHYAAMSMCSDPSFTKELLDKIESRANFNEINPRNESESTPFYYACRNQNISLISTSYLNNELVEINNIGPRNLLTFFTGDNQDYINISNRLRLLGILEAPEGNQDPNARLIQDSQGIHASKVEKSIKRSLEKLRVGKDASIVSSSYENFVNYCNLSNPAFVDDLQAIQVTSQNFSRHLIVKALSVTEAVSENEKVELEKRKLTLFNNAIAHRIQNMTLSSNSDKVVESFKERLGLIWGELNNPERWYKFIDLKEIMDKEGEAFSKNNPSAEFKSALQKLRNVLFIQLVETRYEYEVVLNQGANVNIHSREDFLDGLERSSPSCAGGTNNFIIECFSHRHQDIQILAGQFTQDFTADATLPIRIASKLYDLILASVNTYTEIQTQVNSVTKIQIIEGITIVNEILDRMAGASEKVKMVLPEDEILSEERVKEYFRTGSIPGHSRAIGYLLGFLKLTLQENQDIIGGLPLQPNEDQEEALTEAFRHLEQALANSQTGFLTQALTEARCQYYQSFFKDDLDEQKLIRLVKILTGNERIDIDERELVRTAIIESYGEVESHNNTIGKIITHDKAKLIKNSNWYKTILNHMLNKSQDQAKNSGNMLYNTDDITKKLHGMLGLNLRDERVEKKTGLIVIIELECASSSAILFSKNKASINAQISLESEPKDRQGKIKP